MKGTSNVKWWNRILDLTAFPSLMSRQRSWSILNMEKLFWHEIMTPYMFTYTPLIHVIHSVWYLHKYWLPPDSSHVWWCDTRPRFRFLPACLELRVQCPKPCHTSFFWSWISFQALLFISKQRKSFHNL